MVQGQLTEVGIVEYFLSTCKIPRVDDGASNIIFKSYELIRG